MTTNKPTTYWAPSTALHKLESRHNNAPCILTDCPAEFNDVALVRLADYEALQAAHEEELFCVRQDRDAHFGEMMRAIEQVDAMKAECEKLRNDAKRYQFVRTRVSASNARGPASWTFHYYQLPRPISNPLAGPPAWEHFDAAIDAAMEGDQP